MAAKTKKSKRKNTPQEPTRVSNIHKTFKKNIPINFKRSILTPEKIVHTMSIKEVADKAKKELVELTGFRVPSLVGAKKEGDGWVLSIEVVEKNSIPEGMDILGFYEVKTDGGGDIMRYERKSSRKRADTIGEESEIE